jgi:integrase
MAILKRVSEATNKTSYQVMIDRRDPATGQRKRVTIGTFRTKKEAEKAEREAMTERDRGTLLSPDRTTVSELLDRYLEVVVPRTVRPENIVSYESIIRRQLKPALGAVRVRSLTVEQVELFYASLQAAGYSSSLIRKCHMRLAAALRLGQRWNIVAENVCDTAKPPKLAYKQPDVWTPHEVRAFLDVAEGDILHLYWLLAVETGARTSELLGVSWNDVNFERGTIRFGQQVVRLLHATPIVKQDAKTETGRRTIRLTPDMLAELRAYRTGWLARKLAAPDWDNPHELIFCTANGRPLNARNVRRSFDRLVKAAGVKPISPHGIRKTHITATVAAGGNIKAVAARVGHRDVSTTLKTYTQLIPQMEEDLMEIVETVVPRRSKDGG